MSGLLIAAGIAIALPGALAALHITVLTVASLFYREPQAQPSARLRFLVLIPAHNEELVLDETLAALHRERRPGDLILVVDDRSTDTTAEIARAMGALVVRRTPEMPPGRAAARQDGIRHALTLDWDVLAAIDADSIVEPGYFEACEAILASGADALQARSQATRGKGVLGETFAAASAMQGVTLPRGRDRLGLSVRLKGTGMVVRRWIAETYSFRGPGASEDLCFSLDLCRDGVLPRHADSARLRSQTARSLSAASQQRARWEAGRLLMAREHLLPLLGRHDPASLEAALHLLTPPVALAALSLALASVLLALAGAAALALGSLVLLICLVLDTAVALTAARAALGTWLALLVAPAYLLWKLFVQFRALTAVAQRKPYFPPIARD